MPHMVSTAALWSLLAGLSVCVVGLLPHPAEIVLDTPPGILLSWYPSRHPSRHSALLAVLALHPMGRLGCFHFSRV